MSKLLYTRFTKLIIDYLLSLNKSIPYRSDSKLHILQDDHPITKLLSTTNCEYKFGMEVLDYMISDAIKKKAGYKYYMAKKVESEKAKIVDEPEEQHVSPIKSRRGKGFMCYGDQVTYVPNKLKKDVVPRETRSLTKKSLLDLQKGSKASRLESLRQKKQPVAGDGSSVAHNKYYSSSYTASDATLYSSSSDESEESANETDDADESDMDLPDDNLHGDDDAAKYRVFMHNKSTATPDSTYLSPTVTNTLDAQAAHSSFHKRSHGNQDPPNNCEGENKKKIRTDVGEPSSRSLRRNRSPVAIVQDDTPAMQPLDKADILIHKPSNPEWFLKKMGLAKRRTTWFDLLLKSDIDKNEKHILGPLTVVIAKKFKELIQKDELTIADLEGAGLKWLKVQYNIDVELEYHVCPLKAAVLSEAQWNSDEEDVSKPISFERHMSKSTKPHPCFYNNDYSYLVDLSIE
ncbi:hypothetical protein Tco_0832931 [Tanacetum coccineum]